MFMVFLVAIILIINGCGTSKPTPTPTPQGDLYIHLIFENNSTIASNRFYVVITGLDRLRQSGFFDLTKIPIEF